MIYVITDCFHVFDFRPKFVPGIQRHLACVFSGGAHYLIAEAVEQ